MVTGSHGECLRWLTCAVQSLSSRSTPARLNWRWTQGTFRQCGCGLSNDWGKLEEGVVTFLSRCPPQSGQRLHRW